MSLFSVETLTSLILAVVRDLTGYGLLRLFGIRRRNFIAASFVGLSFWISIVGLLMWLAHPA